VRYPEPARMNRVVPDDRDRRAALLGERPRPVSPGPTGARRCSGGPASSPTAPPSSCSRQSQAGSVSLGAYRRTCRDVVAAAIAAAAEELTETSLCGLVSGRVIAHVALVAIVVVGITPVPVSSRWQVASFGGCSPTPAFLGRYCCSRQQTDSPSLWQRWESASARYGGEKPLDRFSEGIDRAQDRTSRETAGHVTGDPALTRRVLREFGRRRAPGAGRSAPIMWHPTRTKRSWSWQ
jgi:hypothetical protein